MSASHYYRPNDRVLDIFSTKHGIVEEVRTCSTCIHQPCPLSMRNGDEGCMTVRLVSGMLVQREAREVTKPKGFTMIATCGK